MCTQGPAAARAGAWGCIAGAGKLATAVSASRSEELEKRGGKSRAGQSKARASAGAAIPAPPPRTLPCSHSPGPAAERSLPRRGPGGGRLLLPRPPTGCCRPAVLNPRRSGHHLFWRGKRTPRLVRSPNAGAHLVGGITAVLGFQDPHAHSRQGWGGGVITGGSTPSSPNQYPKATPGRGRELPRCSRSD